MLDTRFIAFLGEGEPEELLPLDEAERERLLLDKTRKTFYSSKFELLDLEFR